MPYYVRSNDDNRAIVFESLAHAKLFAKDPYAPKITGLESTPCVRCNNELYEMPEYCTITNIGGYNSFYGWCKCWVEIWECPYCFAVFEVDQSW